MTYSRPHMLFGLTLMAAGAMLFVQQGCQPNAQPSAGNSADSESCCASKGSSPANCGKCPEETTPKEKWESLFDGKTLAGWKTPKFGGEGKVHVDDDAIVMDTGSNMTGIAWTGDVPRNNYELSLEGKRLEGADFFCTTTFPVGTESCSLVVGGWGGGLVGLSSVNGHDASDNSTSRYVAFKKDQWYRVRIRVTDAAVQAWLDDEQLVNQPRKGYKFGVRAEVEQCRPLGISTWATKGAVRKIQIRPIEPTP
jgi:hypothetical protein